MSFLANINKVQTFRANLNYLNKLSQETEHLCIVDGGADTHVGGKAWLSLIDLQGPCVKLVNVIGFDENTTRKTGLPIGDMVAKCITQEGETKFLCAKHMIVNVSSQHTLLSSYQMRELGMVVDDVSRRHFKSPFEHGTQTIQATKEDLIDLKTRAALSTLVYKHNL